MLKQQKVRETFHISSLLLWFSGDDGRVILGVSLILLT